jgi:uncharacterized delta-60 repeat protein
MRLMVRPRSSGAGEVRPARSVTCAPRCLTVLLALLFCLLALDSTAYGAGELDPTFDGDGRVLTDFGGSEFGDDIALQADGKIVAVGSTSTAGGDFGLARYNPDGSLDPTFDSDGRVVTDFGAGEDAFGVAIQADGKIVAVGTGSGGDNPTNFALARYNPDGSLDPTFGGDGMVLVDLGADEEAFDVAIQADGKIVAAGRSSGDFGLARYNLDGSLDPSFGGDGGIVTDFGANDQALGVALQADGKIVAAGETNTGFVPSLDFALARYNPDGSLDPPFDGDGRVVTDFGAAEWAYGVAIQADGKIVAAGTSFDASFTPDNFVLARYNPDGSLDASFDSDGRVVTDFGTAGEGAFGVAIQADSRIVAAGLSNVLSNENFALARYNPNGSLDPTFDGDGRVVTDFGAEEEASAVAIQADGNIVAMGWSNFLDNDNFALARYLSDGTTKPQISVNDVARLEGNAGLTTFEFTVSLSKPSSQTITVSRQTQDGTATTADSDYTGLSAATITFNPNETQKQVTVNAAGDTKIEPDETFFVNLSGASNATIADGQGQGTIQNDDLSASQPCTITGTSGSNVLSGTAGDDVICAGDGDDQVSGLGGRDVLIGGSGKDLLVGGADPDLLLGGGGYDDLRGQSGNDTLRGAEGGDSLLLGGSGSDALFGENGLDTLNSQDGVSGNDRTDGGPASDKCTFDAGDFHVNCP